MPTNIYELHDKAFARVSAFVICRNGEKVATVALKFPADGAGRLYAYVHWLGLEMVRGHAGGYGYDKRSAAVIVAARKMDPKGADKRAAENQITEQDARPWHVCYRPFLTALSGYDGTDWTRCLEKAGFTVLQAC